MRPHPRVTHAVALRLAGAAALAALCLSPAAAARPAAADPPRGPGVAVLVHGFQGLLPWSEGYRCADGIVPYAGVGPDGTRGSAVPTSPAARGEFGRLAEALRRHGYTVLAARWTSHGGETASLRDAGACLAGQVAETRRSTSGANASPPPVTLVAHSMGGLVGRAFLEGDARDRATGVARLVTFGTPHLGVAPDVLVRLLALLNPTFVVRGLLPCETSPGLCELSHEAMAGFNRRHRPADGVDYHAVGGTRAVYPFSWFVPGADDGLVETASALGVAATRWRVHDSHTALGGLVADHYFASAESERCLEAALGVAAAGAGCTRLDMGAAGSPGGGDWRHAPQAPGDAAHPAPPAFDDAARWAPEPALPLSVDIRAAAPVSNPPAASDVDMAMLAPGASASFAFALDGSSGRVFLGAAGPGVAARLVLPDGRTLLPEITAAMPAGRAPAPGPGSPGLGLRDATAPPLWFRLTDPPVGPARLEVANGGRAPVSVAAFAVWRSGPALAATVGQGDGAPVRPGGAVVVRARLADGGHGIAGAAVEARWSAGGRVRRIGLVDRGGGDYEATIPAPDAPGLFHVVVRADGRLPDGAPFERAGGAMWVVDDA